MSKRKIKKSIKKIFLFILLIGIVISGTICYKKFFKPKNLPIIKEIPPEIWPKVYKASMLATGDSLLHKPILNEAYNKETDKYDFKYIFNPIKDYINKFDIKYYNQESVFGGKEFGFSSYPLFNSPSDFGDNMVDLGFNLVSLASNHSADCKKNAETCIKNSYNYWATKNVTFDGFNEDETMENKHNIGEKNGITYGFLNYTNTLNGLDSYIKNKYIIDLYDEERVKEEVTALRDKVDVLIVAMHWHKNSPEYSFNPTSSNKEIARYLDSLGVDIILGTYSHCLQPYEFLENGALVFYSLGNLVSNQIYLNNSGYHPYVGAIGMLATLDITKTVYEDGTKEIKIDNLGAELIICNSKKWLYGYEIIPFSQIDSSKLSNYESIYKEYTSYVLKLDDESLKFVPLKEKPLVE